MKTICICVIVLWTTLCKGQDYHAITGSNYAGALGVYNNPASILNTPYPWDVTIAGLQAKYQTNAITVLDYSLLSSPSNSKFLIAGGDFERFGNEQINLNLLNARISIGRKKALAFGLNVRSIANISTSEYNYRDTISSLQSFLSMNTASGELKGQGRTVGFLEGYISYAQTILDRPDFRLNGGLSIKLNRGIAGASASVSNFRYSELSENGITDYLVSQGEFSYGYAAGIDQWKSSQGALKNTKDLLSNSRFGFSLDAGLELLIKPGGVPGYMDDEESFYDYDWKISASLTDVGRTSYNFSENSRQGKVPAQGFSANSLTDKLDGTIHGISDFNDSLATLIPMNSLDGYFNVYSPARIILNVDRFIYGAWFINTEISLGITRLLGDKRLFVKDMNLIRVTPRWETRRWGVFLPVQVNTRGKAWIGAAAKAGPLLIGFHNLANIFSKKSMAGGGGYIAITIKPGTGVTMGKKQKMLDCPPY